MNSLQRLKARRLLLVGAVVAVLAGMIAYNALRPAATEDDRVRAVSDAILQADWEHATPVDRERLRQQWETFTPEVRRQVFTEVAKARLQEMRERLRNLTPETRVEQIRLAVRQIQQRHEQMPAREREQVRERINSAEGKEMVRHVMDFYLHEFTARERAQMDPLLHAWLAEVERLAAGR